MTNPAESHFKNGQYLQQVGEHVAALAAFDAAVLSAPRVPLLHYARGNALVMLRRSPEAVEAYDKCLELNPQHVQAAYARATVLAQLERWFEAAQGFADVVRREPSMADAWINQAGVLQALGRNEEALESARAALRLKPGEARAHYNVGVILLTLNRFEEAAHALSRAYQLNPAHSDALGCLASAALRACDWPMMELIWPELCSRLKAGSVSVPPLTVLTLTDDPALQRRAAELNLTRALAATPTISAGAAQRAYDHDKLRIGYLSSDFRNHPVATHIVGLLEHHDRSRFEVVGLFTGQDDGSQMAKRVVKACDRFFNLAGVGSVEAAAIIRRAEIDILVDLNGHTIGWSPAILSFRPAPVIAAYLGFAGTTGANFVDYILGDPVVTPFEQVGSFSERIVQLGDCFWPGNSQMPAPAVITRAEAGLPADAFVFCSFNSHQKIRPQMFDIWCRLLHSVPHSVLWIREGDGLVDRRFITEARNRGIAADRIVFAPRLNEFDRHLGRHVQADLFLDTFPYNAHATAFDALWAGVPVLTLRGSSFVSRVSATLLTSVGLSELITESAQAYEDTARFLAENPDRLATLRHRLALERETASIFDVSRLVSSIETAYQQMHARFRDGKAPVPLAV